MTDQHLAPSGAPLTATTTRAGDEREAFEAWAKERGHDTLRAPEWKNVDYHSLPCEDAWLGWKARGALANAPEQAAEPYCYIYEYDHGYFGLHRQFAPTEWNGMKPTRTVAVFTAPPSASTNRLTDEQIVEMARDISTLFDDGASIWTRDSLIEFARALLRTSNTSAQEAEDEPLTCDFCGAQTDDPWHTSDATRKHLHQCDACHADSGQRLTLEALGVTANNEGEHQ